MEQILIAIVMWCGNYEVTNHIGYVRSVQCRQRILSCVKEAAHKPNFYQNNVAVCFQKEPKLPE